MGAAFIWNDDSYAVQRLEAAIEGSKNATLRVQGIKARAIVEPPTQIDVRVRFQYPGHRTCAEWLAP